MKAENERVEGLKIGNLVSAVTCDGSEVVDMVSELRLVDDSVFFKTLKGWSKGRPIPLTEEWLLKFGFEREDNDEHMTFQYELKIEYDMYLLSFTSDKDNINLCLELYGFDTDQLGETIYYVHQLQNLYFALTGKELEIN